MSKKLNSFKKLKKLDKPKLPTIKKLQWQAENLCKEIVLKRDSGVCQVQRLYPHVKLSHSSVMQGDHCFSRSYKELFLDLANWTLLCSCCNAAKGPWRDNVVMTLVNEIVIKREGVDVFNRMMEVAQKKEGFTLWSKRHWLEEQIQILKELRDRT